MSGFSPPEILLLCVRKNTPGGNELPFNKENVVIKGAIMGCKGGVPPGSFVPSGPSTSAPGTNAVLCATIYGWASRHATPLRFWFISPLRSEPVTEVYVSSLRGHAKKITPHARLLVLQTRASGRGYQENEGMGTKRNQRDARCRIDTGQHGAGAF